jgi:hypothetical protein
MARAPLNFTADGMLPPGDYPMTFQQLRSSLLIRGPTLPIEGWDTPWRSQLIDGLEVMVRQLWQIGVTDVFVDGSFVEDKVHPNDIDGYFVCDLKKLASGELERELNRLDPHKVWTWDPRARKAFKGYPKSSCQCGISTELSSILTTGSYAAFQTVRQ